ncbi:hypothetical protein [Dickeya lacustris]|uniref:Uncharacterized protein n=1 Tax=Dickeya lacustris TaxID=2259638 RepID=A0ABY8G5F1_9GAMM|nr:hypothetical protein [Dickeya lacustris]WFN55176.1 hypothetical protein O1Q98_16350 [Dickeya lacustris]
MMVIEQPMAFVGTLICFLAGGGKTIYDLYFNPQAFKKDEETMGLVDAAKKKRERADLSTRVTLWIMTIGYVFLLLSTIKLM